MREVIPNILWIGNARDARNVKGVLAAGIGVVIDLAMEEPPIQFPRDIVYCRFPLLDGEGNSTAILRSIIDTTASFVSANQPTLVACSGGMSRSPAIVCAVVAKVQSIDLDKAVERVTATGPCDFSPKLWNDVQKICDSIKPSSSPSLNLIVVRSFDPARTVTFYESLGIRFQEEQHGKGPVHWAVNLDGLVLEVYPAKAEKEVDQTTRLGFEVEDIDDILRRLRPLGIKILTELKSSQWGLRAVVQDPDGRSMELVQP
jgi:predicted enzyme related to lactoylglutathione lyase